MDGWHRGTLGGALEWQSRGRGFMSYWAHGRVKTEGKFYTSMCLCHQAVEVVTGLRVVSPDGWEGNCGPGQKVTAAYCWVYDYACVCRCGLGGRWWQPTSGFMTMQHHLQADC